MSTAEANALYYAFSRVFADLVRRGCIEGDQETLQQFWQAFLRDLSTYPHGWTRQLVS